METYYNNRGFFSQHDRPYFPSSEVESYFPLDGNVIKAFVPQTSTVDTARPPSFHQGQVSNEGQRPKQNQNQDAYSTSHQYEHHSHSGSPTFSPRDHTADSRNHSNHFENFLESRQPLQPRHGECHTDNLTTDFETACSPHSIDAHKVNAPQLRSLSSELNSPASEVSAEVDIDSDFQWIDNPHSFGGHTSSFSDVTSLAISAALNCDQDEAFPVELFSPRGASEYSIAGSRKSSYDSSFDRAGPTSQVGSLDTALTDSLGRDMEPLTSKSVQGSFGNSSTTKNSAKTNASITNLSPAPTFGRLENVHKPVAKDSDMYYLLSADRQYTNMQEDNLNDIEPFPLDFSDVFHNYNGYSNAGYTPQPSRQPTFVPNTPSHMSGTNHEISSPGTVASWPVQNKNMDSVSPGLKASQYTNSVNSHLESMDQSGFQNYKQDKSVILEPHRRASLHNANTLPVRLEAPSALHQQVNFFDDFINAVCRGPGVDSSGQQPAKVDGGMEFQSPSALGPEDSKDEMNGALRSILMKERTCQTVTPSDTIDAEPKLSPGVYQNTPIASIPVSPPPPLERVFASPTIKSESIFQEGNHVMNQWTNPGTPKRENETRSPRGGSGSALHKILDPSWSPDSTTPMDIASAVRYILQKRPDTDCFPLARDIFDASYKILKASKLSSALSKDLGPSADAKVGPGLEKCQTGLGFSEEQQEADGFAPDMAAPSHISPSTKKACKKRPSVLPPCRVCGCSASGLHYGVVTCEACNGFFRRSLKRRAVYFCSKENKCDVTGKKRGECSFCRYHKCLAVGMSRTAVKTGRYSDKTRLAYALESENHVMKGDYPTNRTSRQELHPFSIRTIGRSSSEQGRGQTKGDMTCAEEAMSTDEFDPSRGEHSVSASSANGRPNIMSSFVEMWLCHLIKFVKKVPGFSQLHLTDQTALVKVHWQEIWLLSSYRGRCEAELGSQPSSSTDKAHSNEEKVVFGTRYADLSEKWYRQLKSLDVSQTEVILLMMVCLTSPDCCRLERKTQVSRMHWLMRQALSKHMDKMRVEDAFSFSQILSAALSVKSDIGQSLLAFDSRQLLDSRGQCGVDRPLLLEMLRGPWLESGAGGAFP